ncbi:MAG: ABC transporter permease [Treponema sp.]|jgi:spermidine/putrescine transport system permease protein|nr:ABC transporter permease [Treponema sp.]
MKDRKKINSAFFIMVGPVALWMILFVFIPFVFITVISFMHRSTYGGVSMGITLENILEVFRPDNLKVFGQSFLLATLTTLVCLLIAYPFAYFISQKTAVKKTVFMSLVMVPFMISSLIRLFAWINILRRTGFINSFLMRLGLIHSPLPLVYNTTGAVIGLVYVLLPFMIMPLYSSIEKLDRTLLEACSDLGAGPVTAFLKVTLPLTMPGIFGGIIMTFIPTLGLFFVIDLMGGSKILVMGNLIRNQFITAKNWPLGAAMSLFLIVITLVFVKIYKKSGGSMDALGGGR